MQRPKRVVCVGALVRKADAVLLVRQAPGHPLAGVWTIPWGFLEPGESPSAGSLREVAEEAALRAQVVGLLGVQELPVPWAGWIALVYACRHVEGEPRPDHRETDRAGFFTLADLDALREPVEEWCAWLVRRDLLGSTTILPGEATNPYNPCDGFI